MYVEKHDKNRRLLLKGMMALFFMPLSINSSVAVARSIKSSKLSKLLAVRLWSAQAYTRIAIEADAMLLYRAFFMRKPDRLVVDIKNSLLTPTITAIEKQIPATDPFLKKIRIAQFNQTTVRIVLTLHKVVHVEIFTVKPIAQFSHRLMIAFYQNQLDRALHEDPLLSLLKNRAANQTPNKKKAKNSHKSAPLRKFVVMLDPGHGGEDPGAIGKQGTQEKEVVLKIAKRLQKILHNQSRLEVHMTRTEDLFVPLHLRVAKAKEIEADLFISIHADSNTKREVRGSSVYVLSAAGASSEHARLLAQQQNLADAVGGILPKGSYSEITQVILQLWQRSTIKESLQVGKRLLYELSKINHLLRNKVEQANFVVLRAYKIPSVLVETAFISNLEEERLLRTAAFQQKIAQSLATSIKSYAFQALKKTKSAQ